MDMVIASLVTLLVRKLWLLTVQPVILILRLVVLQSFYTVAGIDRYPRKVTRTMSKNKVEKRSKIKPFVKSINYKHLMPTRYVVDIDLKKVIADDAMNAPESRIEARKTIKKVFEDRFVVWLGLLDDVR